MIIIAASLLVASFAQIMTLQREQITSSWSKSQALIIQ
jgi:hypothetical protein